MIGTEAEITEEIGKANQAMKEQYEKRPNAMETLTWLQTAEANQLLQDVFKVTKIDPGFIIDSVTIQCVGWMVKIHEVGMKAILHNICCTAIAPMLESGTPDFDAFEHQTMLMLISDERAIELRTNLVKAHANVQAAFMAARPDIADMWFIVYSQIVAIHDQVVDSQLDREDLANNLAERIQQAFGMDEEPEQPDLIPQQKPATASLH